MEMNLSKEEFSKYFSKSFVQHLKDSLIPDNKFIKKDIINELYNELISNNYSLQKPRGYIIINKHNNIARVCPTFHAKDYFLFFFCCKMIEDEIAVNRVEGTFGGWRLGNPLKDQEEIEEQQYSDYIPPNVYNPWL
jgi:hypothetical protein